MISVRLFLLTLVLSLSACGMFPKNTKPADVKDINIDAKINPIKPEKSLIVTVPLMNPAVKNLYTQAQIQFKDNAFQKAIISLERAYKVQPQAPEISQLIAEISLHQGNFKQAHYWANIATENGPSKGATCAKSWRILALAAERVGYFANQEMALNKIDDCLVKIKNTF